MVKSFIEFKKQRDFGLILSDTFAFIRNEFKPFMSTVFTISGPALVLFGMGMAFYTYAVGDIFNFGIYNDNIENIGNPLMIVIALLAYLISALLAYIFSASAALHYIKSYIETNGNVDFAEVKQNVHKTFWGYLGLGALKWISLTFAILLCILPVLYVMVPMFIAFCIYIFESRRGPTDAYSYSFYLINEDFWLTIGTMLVLGILMYILSMVFAVPTIIYSYAKMGIFSGEVDIANMNLFSDPIYILLNVLGTLFQLLLNLILVVASALIYFHLNEKKNFTGTYERIGSIGKTED